MKRTTLIKLRAAVKIIHYWGFISEFERDSLLLRIEKSYKTQ